jgi:hypothetical protein
MDFKSGKKGKKGGFGTYITYINGNDTSKKTHP